MCEGKDVCVKIAFVDDRVDIVYRQSVSVVFVYMLNLYMRRMQVPPPSII